jgi:hypothetical protein
MKEFYYAERWQEHVPGTTGAAGAVVMASGVPSHTLWRRKRRSLAHGGLFEAPPPRLLFDPQVYLSSLQPEQCRSVCANLVSYPWFVAEDASEFDSKKQRQREWKKAAREEVVSLWRPPQADRKSIERAVNACTELQLRMQCEALILPSPLTRNPSTDYSLELEWLDVGIERAKALSVSQPILATIAISDTCLSGIAPLENALLETIVDQVSARPVDGAYFVLEQANERGYSCVNEDTIGSVLRAISDLKTGGLRKLVVSYCGLAGLAALCVGADAWVSGWRRSERRLQLKDMEDQTARAFSAYYSHQLAAEINVQKDLPRILGAELLDALADETEESRPLLASMRQTGRPPINWTGQNIKAARTHFMTAVIRETALVSGLPDDAARRAYASNWLAGATALAAKLTVVGNLNERTEISHQRRWRDALKNITDGSAQ